MLVLLEQIERVATPVDEDPAQPGACDSDPRRGACCVTRRRRAVQADGERGGGGGKSGNGESGDLSFDYSFSLRLRRRVFVDAWLEGSAVAPIFPALKRFSISEQIRPEGVFTE